MTVTKIKSKKFLKNGKKKTMKKNNFRKGRSMKGGSNVWNGHNVGSTHFYPGTVGQQPSFIKPVVQQPSFKAPVVGQLPKRFKTSKYRGAAKPWGR